LCAQLRDPVTTAVLDAGLPRLRAVSLFSVGYDNVDIAAATARRVVIGHTPGVLTDATADCALGLMIAAARRLCEGDAVTRAGGFHGIEPEFMLGLDLRNALLGVVGFGRIGPPPGSTSTRTSPGSPPGSSSAGTRCSRPTSAAPPSAPARRWRRCAPTTRSPPSRAGSRPTASTPPPGRRGHHRRGDPAADLRP